MFYDQGGRTAPDRACAGAFKAQYALMDSVLANIITKRRQWVEWRLLDGVGCDRPRRFC